MKKFKFYSMISKSLLILGIILLCMDTNAQIFKGTTVISGDLFTRYRTSENSSGTSKYLNFDLSPSMGVFLAQNFSLNIALGFSYSSYTTPYVSGGENKDITTSYFARPYIQFYKTVTDKFYFNSQIYFSYQMSEDKYTPALGLETKTNTVDLEIGFRPGITYFLTDRIAISSSFGTIGYVMSSEKDTDHKSAQFTTNFGFNSLSFGISFYMTKKI